MILMGTLISAKIAKTKHQKQMRYQSVLISNLHGTEKFATYYESKKQNLFSYLGIDIKFTLERLTLHVLIDHCSVFVCQGTQTVVKVLWYCLVNNWANGKQANIHSLKFFLQLNATKNIKTVHQGVAKIFSFVRLPTNISTWVMCHHTSALSARTGSAARHDIRIIDPHVDKGINK